MRILHAGTAEPLNRVGIEAEIARVQPWVLARQDERRLQPALGERVRDGRHLDRFRPGADDQPDVGETQYSP
jgi:hypothetical protein